MLYMNYLVVHNVHVLFSGTYCTCTYKWYMLYMYHLVVDAVYVGFIYTQYMYHLLYM